MYFTVCILMFLFHCKCVTVDVFCFLENKGQAEVLFCGNPHYATSVVNWAEPVLNQKYFFKGKANSSIPCHVSIQCKLKMCIAVQSTQYSLGSFLFPILCIWLKLFIRSDCVAFDQFVHSLGIKPMTLALFY